MEKQINMSKKSDNEKYLWEQYELHKKAAHDHFEAGRAEEKEGKLNDAYKSYGKSYASRAHADSLWVQLRGPFAADGGHAFFTATTILEHRDRVHKLLEKNQEAHDQGNAGQRKEAHVQGNGGQTDGKRKEAHGQGTAGQRKEAYGQGHETDYKRKEAHGQGDAGQTDGMRTHGQGTAGHRKEAHGQDHAFEKRKEAHGEGKAGQRKEAQAHEGHTGHTDDKRKEAHGQGKGVQRKEAHAQGHAGQTDAKKPDNFHRNKH